MSSQMVVTMLVFLLKYIFHFYRDIVDTLQHCGSLRYTAYELDLHKSLFNQ